MVSEGEKGPIAGIEPGSLGFGPEKTVRGIEERSAKIAVAAARSVDSSDRIAQKDIAHLRALEDEKEIASLEKKLSVEEDDVLKEKLQDGISSIKEDGFGGDAPVEAAKVLSEYASQMPIEELKKQKINRHADEIEGNFLARTYQRTRNFFRGKKPE